MKEVIVYISAASNFHPNLRTQDGREIVPVAFLHSGEDSEWIVSVGGVDDACWEMRSRSESKAWLAFVTLLGHSVNGLTIEACYEIGLTGGN